MKKNRPLILRGTLMLMLSLIMIVATFAQDHKKEEKKTIKVKVITDEEGGVKIDTTFILDEDFDGDWKALIDDEALREEIKNIELKINHSEKGHVFIEKKDGDQTKTYKYIVTSGDKGEIDVEVEQTGNTQEFTIKKMKGDSVYKVMLREDGKGKHTDQEVMIWQVDDDADLDELMHKEMHGEMKKVIIVSSDGDEQEIKVIKDKEVIIITAEEDNRKHKKKKKKKDRKK